MKKVLLILLARVAVGMLLAPEKGSDTSKKIVDGVALLQVSHIGNCILCFFKNWIFLTGNFKIAGFS
jgi:hypothetical protein